MNLTNNRWTNEEKFGMRVSFGVHLVLLLLFGLIRVDAVEEQRTAFIEVELGEFRTGSLAQRADNQASQVEKRRNPSKTDQKNSSPNSKPDNKTETSKKNEKAKPVDAPEQNQKVESEVIKTPETEFIDPKTTSDQNKQDLSVAPKAVRDEQEQEGEKESGDTQGLRGELNVDQGTGTDADKSTPFSLKWDGNIERAAQVQPLPNYSQEVEAVITVRFEVRPDGSISKMIPLKKMNPELENEILKTLRTWKFSRLPSGVPQQSQWGTITFRFVLN